MKKAIKIDSFKELEMCKMAMLSLICDKFEITEEQIIKEINKITRNPIKGSIEEK